MAQEGKQLTIVKTLTNNMRRIAALPKDQHPEARFAALSQKPGEKDSDYRKRALEVIGEWWGYGGSSVRSMEDGYRDGHKSRRFLDDLRQYGAVTFVKKTGALNRASLGKGPDPLDYVMGAAERKRPTRSRART